MMETPPTVVGFIERTETRAEKLKERERRGEAAKRERQREREFGHTFFKPFFFQRCQHTYYFFCVFHIVQQDLYILSYLSRECMSKCIHISKVYGDLVFARTRSQGNKLPSESTCVTVRRN